MITVHPQLKIRQSQVPSELETEGGTGPVYLTGSLKSDGANKAKPSPLLCGPSLSLELRYAPLALATSAHRILAPKASRIDISHQCSITCLLPLHAAACVAVCDRARRTDRPHRKPNEDLGHGIQWRSHGPVSIACCRRSSLLLLFLASLSFPLGVFLRFGFCRVACSAIPFLIYIRAVLQDWPHRHQRCPSHVLLAAVLRQRPQTDDHQERSQVPKAGHRRAGVTPEAASVLEEQQAGPLHSRLLSAAGGAQKLCGRGEPWQHGLILQWSPAAPAAGPYAQRGQ